MNRTATYLLFAVVGLITASGAQTGFVHTPKDHWPFLAVTDSQARGVLIGYPGGSFIRPATDHNGKFASPLKPKTDGHPRKSAIKASSYSMPVPGPTLTPEQVVRIQMKALQHNDLPMKDSGIATTFRFASPQNQVQTGPLEHFMLIVKNPTYAPMLNCKSVAYGELKQMGDQATQTVSITAIDGSILRYVFLLSRQTSGVHNGCWMADGCVKVDGGPRIPRPDETAILRGNVFAF